ncbi:MAG: alpha/beta fold hydrolase [Acidimicrobiia bacterium]
MKATVPPETKFARGPEGAVAYQVFGEGPPDLVFVTQWSTNIDTFWDEPSAARYLDRLASFSRVILLDKRGTGVSDPIASPELPTMDVWREDITCVLDEVGVEEAVLFGDAEGGLMCIAYAAAHPERVTSLVLANSQARAMRADDYPEGMPPDIVERTWDVFVSTYGQDGILLVRTAPSVANDARFVRWWLKFQRSTMPPGTVGRGLDWVLRQDVREEAKALDLPTLVIHREDAFYHRIAGGKWLADNIPNARFVVLPGADTLPFHTGDFNAVLDHVEEFVTGETSNSASDRKLATVLFTDIVASTETAAQLGDERWTDLLAEINEISAQQVRRFGGQTVFTTGDGHLATFDVPARAIDAARQILFEVGALDVQLRAGIHTGEITLTGDNIAGIGVHIASRVIDRAPDGRIAVSSTVKDLTVGSSITYDLLGTYQLKGVPGDWDIYEVV